MKVIKKIQKWDKHIQHIYYIINKDDIIGSCSVELKGDLTPFLVGMYVYPEYRRMKYSHMLMESILKDFNELIIAVRPDNFIIPFYESYGFVNVDDEYSEDYIVDGVKYLRFLLNVS